MVEDRWRRLIGPGVVALALLAGAGSVALGAAVPWWDPPECPGGPDTIVAAARQRPAGADPAALVPWSEMTPVLDGRGSLAGQRLAIGIGSDRHRLALPPESFAAGPYGRVVLVGADDGRRSRLRAIDLTLGCAWIVADEAAVVRRATVSPDGATLLEMRVDRTSRADLGIWLRPLDQRQPPRRILPPIPPDGRFGRTWSTEFAWSVDGDRIAVQSCGLVACRTRLLDPGTGRADLVAEPDLGPIVGLTRDRLVVYRACRGFPCPVVSVDPVTGRRAVVSEASGAAVVTGRGDGARIVHEWRDGLGHLHVRSTDTDGDGAVELRTRRLDPLAPAPEVSR